MAQKVGIMNSPHRIPKVSIQHRPFQDEKEVFLIRCSHLVKVSLTINMRNTEKSLSNAATLGHIYKLRQQTRFDKCLLFL